MNAIVISYCLKWFNRLLCFSGLLSENFGLLLENRLNALFFIHFDFTFAFAVYEHSVRACSHRTSENISL